MKQRLRQIPDYYRSSVHQLKMKIKVIFGNRKREKARETFKDMQPATTVSRDGRGWLRISKCISYFISYFISAIAVLVCVSVCICVCVCLLVRSEGEVKEREREEERERDFSCLNTGTKE